MKQPKYKFYASLLDSFTEFLDVKAEEFFYQDDQGAWHVNMNQDTGEMRYTDEEVYQLAKQQLLDMINRVDGEPSEAADKGTALNEIVDCIIEKRKPSQGISVERYYPTTGGAATAFSAAIDGFVFNFDINMCKQIANYFNGSVCQAFTSAPLETKYGVVELYGYPDYIRENKVYDLKTTKQYQFGKYEKKWQKHVYPYCLIKSGKCVEVKEFEYTCVKLSGGTSRMPIITGQMYPEVYTFDFEMSEQMLVQHCERFIEFLEQNKDLITDKKIFGL